MKRTVFAILLLALLLPGGKKLDPESEDFYKKAQLIMTKQEEKEFLSLKTPEERKKFIEEFWKKRDPDPSTPVNEFKQEYMRRIAVAAKYFREGPRPGWLTDRGRIFVLLGPPNKRDQYPMYKGTNKSAEVWYYEDYRLTLEFVDEMGTGEYKLINPPPTLLSVLEQAKQELLRGKQILAKQALDIKAELDRKEKKLYIKIPLTSLAYRKGKEKGKLEAHIVLHFKYSDKEGKGGSFSKEMRIPVRKEDIERGDANISIPVNLAPLKGEYVLEIAIEDKIAEEIIRKKYKVKLK